MLILPAIDLRGGRCVRLRQGDFGQETVFGDDPASTARKWVQQGAAFLHLVDLDGAREGRPINGPTIRAIVDAVGVPCQLGGGIRSEADIEQALAWGVNRVVLGTRAAQEPGWLERVTHQFAGRIVLGIDAKAGRVATQGWERTADLTALELARRTAGWPLAALVYTDVSRDGMLEGPNLDALAEMVAAVDVPVIASGGVTTLEDIGKLKALGVAGCIIGRALYEGRLALADALAHAQ